MELDLISEYKSRALQPTLSEVIANLDLSTSYTYPHLRAYLVAQGVCSARAFKAARYEAYVKKLLGSFPETAAELVDVIVENYNVRASTSSVGLEWNCPMTAMRQQCDQIKLEQEAHRINDTILGNSIREANISRAVSYWMQASRTDEQQRRFQELCRSGTFDWTAFADITLEDGRVAREIQVAVIQKFIWQVKRRMAGLPVVDCQSSIT